jgi:hypothetical protein
VRHAFSGTGPGAGLARQADPRRRAVPARWRHRHHCPRGDAEGGRPTGWTFVIDNKPGAGGNLGVDAAAKSPDGYTLVLGQTSNLAINPTLYAKMPYDSQKDLAPIVLVANAPLVMVTGVGTRPTRRWPMP